MDGVFYFFIFLAFWERHSSVARGTLLLWFENRLHLESHRIFSIAERAKTSSFVRTDDGVKRMSFLVTLNDAMQMSCEHLPMISALTLLRMFLLSFLDTLQLGFLSQSDIQLMTFCQFFYYFEHLEKFCEKGARMNTFSSFFLREYFDLYAQLTGF